MQFHPSYHLSRVSPLPLGMGYLRKIAVALHSCYSSAYCLMGLLFGCGVFPHSHSSTTQPLLQLIVLGSKITADGDCSPEIKMLAPWKKSYDQPRQNIKKQRYSFPTKFHLVKTMIFPVLMCGCESWTIKKAEHRRIDASELWHWRRLLRAPWTARRSNQSILEEIGPEYSLEGLMLKLKLQYFGHPI